ncbi:MAG: pseudouridine synthase [Pseudomonadota bacterium]
MRIGRSATTSLDVPPSGERIQKRLSHAGLGSRREIEAWIVAGRVTVNGRLAQLGDRVNDTDRLAVDGRRLQIQHLEPRERRVLLYHKPEGEVVTRLDPSGRPTVFEHLPFPQGGRWVTVGRLDLNTAGLLLFTNDGELAHRLMHPSYELSREYAVRVWGDVEPAQIARLLDGIDLEDGPARFETIQAAGGTGVNHWYHVSLREGRHHEVRRLWEAVGVSVSRLIRVRYGPILLGRLRAGQWRELDPDEIDDLRIAADLLDSPSAWMPDERPPVKASGRRAR